jgi:hypothetical protein
MQPSLTNGAEMHEQMCGSQASKCGGKVPPGPICLVGKECFCVVDEEKSVGAEKFGQKSTPAR